MIYKQKNWKVKSIPRQLWRTKKHSQNTVGFTLCWPTTAGHGPALQCVLYTQWDSIGENRLSFVVSCPLWIADSGIGLCPLLSELTSSAFDLCWPCACCHSLWAPVCISPVLSRRPCFLAVNHPHWLLPAPWAPRGEFVAGLVLPFSSCSVRSSFHCHRNCAPDGLFMFSELRSFVFSYRALQ